MSDSYIPIKFVNLIAKNGCKLFLKASDIVGISVNTTGTVVTLSNNSDWLVNNDMDTVVTMVEEVLSGQFFRGTEE